MARRQSMRGRGPGGGVQRGQARCRGARGGAEAWAMAGVRVRYSRRSGAGAALDKGGARRKTPGGSGQALGLGAGLGQKWPGGEKRRRGRQLGQRAGRKWARPKRENGLSPKEKGD